jgi:hypothetical protein
MMQRKDEAIQIAVIMEARRRRNKEVRIRIANLEVGSTQLSFAIVLPTLPSFLQRRVNSETLAKWVMT